MSETKQNVFSCWNDHENPNKDLKPAKNIFQHSDYVFQRKVLMSAPMNNSKRKDLEEFVIAARYPALN